MLQHVPPFLCSLFLVLWFILTHSYGYTRGLFIIALIFLLCGIGIINPFRIGLGVSDILHLIMIIVTWGNSPRLAVIRTYWRCYIYLPVPYFLQT